MPELGTLNKKALVDFATSLGVDVKGLSTKTQIIEAIKASENYKGESAMEENQVLENPVVENREGGEVDTTLPEGVEAQTAEQTFEIEGKPVSKSEFIRHQFTANNLSRKEISEQFGIEYRTVYGATVNMTNDAAATPRGRSASHTIIEVTEDHKVVTVVDGVLHINQEAQLEGTVVPATTSVDRNTWIKERVAAGADRAEIAKALGLSYGAVYSLTKGEGAGREKIMMDYEGEQVTRSEYIRRRVASGVSKADVAKELGVEYSVVWGATKAQKTTAEKYADAIAKVAGFAEFMEDKDSFTALIEGLKVMVLKAEETDAEAPAENSEVTE